jgi:hypothetical protein
MRTSPAHPPAQGKAYSASVFTEAHPGACQQH